MLASFAVAIKLIAADGVTIFDLRQQQPDSGHHLTVALTFLCAAILLWFNAEFTPRRWTFNAADELDRTALTITSYVAATIALTGLWVFFPESWTVVAWLALSLVLGQLPDRFSLTTLATQADLIALSAIARIVGINLQSTAHMGHVSVRVFTVALAAALLYLGMRRKTRGLGLARDYIPAGYSWVASTLLAVLAWYELEPIAVAVAWGVLALILFELGHG